MTQEQPAWVQLQEAEDIAELRRQLEELRRTTSVQLREAQHQCVHQQQELRAQQQSTEEAEQRANAAEEAADQTHGTTRSLQNELDAGRHQARLQVLEAREEVRERLERLLDGTLREKELAMRGKQDLEEALQRKEMELADKDEELIRLRERMDLLESGTREQQYQIPLPVDREQPRSPTCPGTLEDNRQFYPQPHTPAIHPINLPKLSRFSGERQGDEDAIEQFLREFERHSQLAAWVGETKRLQFEVHLSGRALKVYDSLPAERRRDYDSAKEAWREQMQPVRLESYKCSQFNSRRQQQGETVNDFACDLQRLMDKAYDRHHLEPALRDKILLGQFAQGLLIRWKRQLKYPLDTFEDAIQQARMAEAVEEQLLTETPKEHKPGVGDRMVIQDKRWPKRGNPYHDPGDRAPMYERRWPRKNITRQESIPPSDSRQDVILYGKRQDHKRPIVCYICSKKGHYASQCPANQKFLETRGHRGSEHKTPVQTLNAISNPENKERDSNPTIETLDQRLQRVETEYKELQFLKLQGEYSQYPEDEARVGLVNGLTAPLAYVEVSVAGIETEAMLDTGSSVNVISQKLFFDIGKAAGIPASALKRPDIPLKDLWYGHHHIPVVACVELTVDARGRQITDIVYILPEADPPFLLGLQASCQLGLVTLAPEVKVHQATEQHQKGTGKEDNVPVVCLIQACQIPKEHGALLQVEVNGDFNRATPLLFEPSLEWMERSGVVIEGSLVHPDAEGRAYLLANNYGDSVVKLMRGDTLGLVEPCSLHDDQPVPDACISAIQSHLEETIDSVEPVEEEQPQREPLTSIMDLTETVLPSEAATQMMSLVSEYSDVFAVSDAELGRTHLVEHVIETSNHPPIKQRPRREAFSYRPKIVNMIQDMLKRGIIQPSSSPWSSPIVVVRKKDGTLRFCVDYRKLNAATTKDVFPLPRVDDLVDCLGGAKIFTTLDEASGYWQIPMSTNSQPLTAFTTHHGLFEFKVMPFGLCNAPATFQRLM